MLLFLCFYLKLFKCHPELVSGSVQMLKQVQHDKIILNSKKPLFQEAFLLYQLTPVSIVVFR